MIAQVSVVSLLDFGNIDNLDGKYLKDFTNELDKYVGTWMVSIEGNVLTVDLKKIEQKYNGHWYEDVIVGEYKYVENGLVVCDYLYRLNAPEVLDSQHYMEGNYIISRGQQIPCDDCDRAELRLNGFFYDPELIDYISFGFILRFRQVLGSEQLELTIFDNETIVLPYENASTDPSIPLGTYVLEKQN
ncbi:MAG: hypothetical protein BM564_12880 [Bacteroidetes bacterium MedPE-SWsnd-G2]|nr:MAG: hypothetical protein BM564_12880 [Bacteroidetes bacterium MedPE-SWsnd-G2]